MSTLQSTINSSMGSTVGSTVGSTIQSNMGSTINSTGGSTVSSTGVSTISSTMGSSINSNDSNTRISTAISQANVETNPIAQYPINQTLKVSSPLTFDKTDSNGVRTQFNFNLSTGMGTLTATDTNGNSTSMNMNPQNNSAIKFISLSKTDGSGATTQLVVNPMEKSGYLMTIDSSGTTSVTKYIDSNAPEKKDDPIVHITSTSTPVSTYPESKDLIKCKIDIEAIKAKIEPLRSAYSKLRSPDDYVYMLLSDSFYNTVIDVTNMLNQYSFDTIKCISDGDKSNDINVCKKIRDGDMKTSIMLEKYKVIELFDKYEPTFRNLLTKINKTIDESYKTCNITNTTSLNKLRILQSRIASLFVTNDTIYEKLQEFLNGNPTDPNNAKFLALCKSKCQVCPNNSGKIVVSNETFYSVMSVMICIIITLIASAIYFAFRTNNN